MSVATKQAMLKTVELEEEMISIWSASELHK
jgi:hypothetical protein